MPKRRGKKRRERPGPQIEAVRTRAAAMARATAGRSRVFADRHKAVPPAQEAIQKALDECAEGE